MLHYSFTLINSQVANALFDVAKIVCEITMFGPGFVILYNWWILLRLTSCFVNLENNDVHPGEAEVIPDLYLLSFFD